MLKSLISEETNIYNQMYDNNKIDYRLKIINNSKRLKMRNMNTLR